MSKRLAGWLLIGLLLVSMGVVQAEDMRLHTCTYEEYLRQLPSSEYGNEAITIDVAQGKNEQGADVYVQENSLCWENGTGMVTWAFEAAQSGLYELEIDYLPLQGNGVSIERTVLIDGLLPYREAYGVQLTRRWDRKNEKIRSDNQGNEIRPALAEKPRQMTTRVYSSDGLFASPLAFYVEAGQHTLSLVSIREPIQIDAMRLMPPEAAPAYTAPDTAALSALPTIKLQGEKATAVSHQTLYPVADVFNSNTEPFMLGTTLMNHIGSYNWRMPGQWIEWEFEVEQTGYYQLISRVEQTYLVGLPVTRRITIDGALPCAEMSSVSFPYSSEWYMHTLKDAKGEPLWIYLTEGTHTLRMEVNLGELAEIVRTVRQVATQLTTLYYRVIMITGTVPDFYRDYQLEKRLVGIDKELQDAAVTLRSQIDKIHTLAGGRVAEAQLLETMATQLESLALDPDTLPSRLDNFRENFTGLSSWVLSITEQPLSIDYWVLAGRDYQAPAANPGFFQKLSNSVGSFFLSFTKDYSNLGNVYDSEQAITVWAAMGQEQAATLKTLIDEVFTAETGIAVNMNILASTDTMLYAASEGNPPEVVLGVGGTLPVDYGIRTALVDLREFEDYDEVISQFFPSALVPFTYEHKVYALPISQTFPLLFYRTDILHDLGVEVPQTWDDVYATIAQLQENNLTLGAGGFFDMFLLQNGGVYYSEENDRCLLDSAEGIEAFERYTELYTHYGLPQEYDLFNRFRTGEMPIGIADFTTYNTLAVAAPEIRGLWSVAPVPGTIREDGHIDRSITGGANACVMFSAAKNREAGWIFLKWFLSKETQIAYGQELEAVLGSGARYATANVSAMDGLTWPEEIYQIIREQWENVVGIPVIPGSYYVSRHMNNAFREVVSLGELPREAMTKYVEQINSEITKKREEFGLITVSEVKP